MELDAAYWENRYKNDQTGWDIGYPSDPIISYVSQLEDRSIDILIPGAGNAWEASWLYENGYKNITVIDIAATPLENFKERMPDFPEHQLLHADLFEHGKRYDLILEQTFFCALLPERRREYAAKMQQLLKPEGKLAGLLFDFPNTGSGPPFGGSKAEYEQLFKPFFKIQKLEPCYNSIKPRRGKELFFIFEKKQP
ncbi:methyltransferase domain-containing protein [Robertkochia flava]|uniref:methyltransferase domain-containing protein n=1 Tax=Robertkochia flava TaxID=3447986 RepID=UPI001CCBB1D5|nr:methyltransferase domain-containing protein [Robertkochia marina]